VLFPSLFGWQSVVAAQSDPVSFCLAVMVALHVGNAVALLVYFWPDWLVIITAWLGTLAWRRVETPTERLAWLIIIATIPAGILALVLEHPLRVALAHSLAAAVFLIINGIILFAAQRFRRRTLNPARSLATPTGRAAAPAPAGTPHLDALTYREAGLLGVAQSTALIAEISRERSSWAPGSPAASTTRTPPGSPSSWPPPIILAAGVVKLPDLLGPWETACGPEPRSAPWLPE